MGGRPFPEKTSSFLSFLFFVFFPKALVCFVCFVAPEKWWLEDYFPIGKVTFQRLC